MDSSNNDLSRAGQKWTKEEENKLLEYIKTKEMSECAKLLHRSDRSIFCKLKVIACDMYMNKTPIEEIYKKTKIDEEYILNYFATIEKVKERNKSDNKNIIEKLNKIEKDIELIKEVLLDKSQTKVIPEDSDLQSVPEPEYILRFDGGCDPNPGNGGCGSVILKNNKIIAEKSRKLENTTNNKAEYKGLILGLKKAIKLNIKTILIQGDSKLVINQVSNLWKIKNEGLKPLHAKTQELLKNFDNYKLEWIPRDKNTIADRLSKECRN
jgi:ribonuclease HI